MDSKIVEIRTTLQHVFGMGIEEIAQEKGGVQRLSKLTGLIFVEIRVIGFLEKPAASLNYPSCCRTPCKTNLNSMCGLASQKKIVCRLLAIRLSPEAVEERRRKLREKAHRSIACAGRLSYCSNCGKVSVGLIALQDTLENVCCVRFMQN